MKFALITICVICVICGFVFAQTDTFFSEWRPNAETRGIRFVGSKACVDCHAREAKQLNTPMAQALEVAPDCRIVTAAGKLTFRNGPYTYNVSRQGASIAYSVSRPLPCASFVERPPEFKRSRCRQDF